MHRILSKSWFFAAILLVAFALRVGLGNRPLWFDEAKAYWQASGSALVPASPGFSGVHVWLMKPLVGRWDEPWMLRLPFIALGTASVLFFALAVRELMGKELAGLTALLLALSPFHVYYCSELRMYPIALLGGALNVLFFVRAVRRGGWANWLGYWAGSVIALSALWHVVLLLVVEGFYLLSDRARRQMLAAWLWTLAAIAATCAPALYNAIQVKLAFPDTFRWIQSRPLIALPGTLYVFTMGVASTSEPWWIALSAVAAGICGVLSIRGALVRSGHRVLVLGGFAFPLLAMVLLSAWLPIYNDQTARYLVFAQPFALLLFAAGWTAIRSGAARGTLLTVLLGVFVAALWPMYFQWNEVGMGDCRPVVERLRREAQPTDCIAASRNVGLPVAYYLRDGLVRQMILGSPRELPKSFPAAERLWIVTMASRSILEQLRDHTQGPPLTPPGLPGYRLIESRIYPGRRPILLALYDR